MSNVISVTTSNRISVTTDAETGEVTIILPAASADLLVNYAVRGADAAGQYDVRDKIAQLWSAVHGGYPATLAPLKGK